MQKDGTQVVYPCTRTQIKQPTNGLAGSDRSTGRDGSANGNGPDDIDGLSVGFVDVKVTGSEVLPTSTTWSVNLSMSLTRPTDGDSRVKVCLVVRSGTNRFQEVRSGKMIFSKIPAVFYTEKSL